MLVLVFLLTFAAVYLVSYSVAPAIYNRSQIIQEKRQGKLAQSMEQFLPRQEARKLSKLFLFSPVMFAVGGFMLAPEEMQLYGIIGGVLFGFIFPGMYVNFLKNKNREKFHNQLIDALMIMSSSFRGGLSLVQAMEAVVEEMPDPINKEFGTVLGENKMGVSLEEALYHLYTRMPSTAVQQMITAILLARETGGNLPVIFTRIVTNIRENKKIQQNLATLTVQGKIQGGVMSLLPLAFAFIVYSTNRSIFNHMIESQLGKSLLIYAAISWLIGAFLVWKISVFKDF